jgi:DNA-directed RNA polymerase subunit RPC12/RpoP
MKRLFYIDYPQEHVEGQMHTYRCAHCKVLTTTINGKLEGHLPTCEYRIRMESKGFELEGASGKSVTSPADETD